MIELPPNTHPEHHFFQQFRYDAHLMFYCHDETHSFSKPTEAMDSFREGITREFLNRVRCKLGLRDTELIFLACSEYGKANVGHVHVLISLDPLRRNGLTAPKFAQAQKRLENAVNEVESQMFRDTIKVTIKNIGKELSDSTDCLIYVCKLEPGHPFKSFFYPKWFKATRKATDSRAESTFKVTLK
jgi:hypothetical protein